MAEMTTLLGMNFEDALQASREFILLAMDFNEDTEVVIDRRILRVRLAVGLGLSRSELEAGQPSARDQHFADLMKDDTKKGLGGNIATDEDLVKELKEKNKVSGSAFASKPGLADTKDDIDLWRTLQNHQLKWRYSLYKHILEADVTNYEADPELYDVEIMNIADQAMIDRIRLLKRILKNGTEQLMEIVDLELKSTFEGVNKAFHVLILQVLQDQQGTIRKLTPMRNCELANFSVTRTSSRLVELSSLNTSTLEVEHQPEVGINTNISNWMTSTLLESAHRGLPALLRSAVSLMADIYGLHVIAVILKLAPLEELFKCCFNPKTRMNFLLRLSSSVQTGYITRIVRHLMKHVHIGDIFKKDDFVKCVMKESKNFIVSEVIAGSPVTKVLDQMSSAIINEILDQPEFTFSKDVQVYENYDYKGTISALLKRRLTQILTVIAERSEESAKTDESKIVAIFEQTYEDFIQLTLFTVRRGFEYLLPVACEALKNSGVGLVFDSLVKSEIINVEGLRAMKRSTTLTKEQMALVACKTEKRGPEDENGGRKRSKHE